MTILFLARRYSYFRNYDSVIRSLAARGHRLHLAVERENEEGRPLVDRLMDECPGITCGEMTPRANDDWGWLASRFRFGIEYLRYQQRMFRDTPKLRERSRERTPGAFVRLGDAVRRYAPWLRRPVTAVLDWLERAVPPDPDIAAFVQAHTPDVVLLTPLIGLGSFQLDYLRAARALRIPTGLAVWSWDHLSSKAIIRDLPDRVFVWNETQRTEALTFHRVPPERVLVTGAQCFDQWFDRQPSRDRAALCQAAGLRRDRPYILWVCSSPFLGSAPEAPFVVEWVRRIRQSVDAALAAMPILIRPHPGRRAEWDSVDLSGLSDVAVWGGTPIDASSRADYFDSLFHSAAVVGLNTSAFIEAGITGRPVLTLLLPEWHENQLGTAHFRYLFEAGGGLLIAARSFEEHLTQLADAVSRPPAGPRPFVRAFVRPFGLDVPATPRFVEGVEALAGMRPAAPAPVPLAGLAIRLLERIRPWREDLTRETLVYAECELETVRRRRAGRAVKAALDRDKKQARIKERIARDVVRQAELQRFREAKQAGHTDEPGEDPTR